MNRTNSRRKGATAERELAQFCTAHGFPARRGQQFSGSPESPDVVCESLARFHIECKRVEAGNPYTWLAQADKDRSPEQVPLVCHRRNGKPWLAILPLSDFLKLLKNTHDPRTETIHPATTQS